MPTVSAAWATPPINDSPTPAASSPSRLDNPTAKSQQCL